SWGEFFHLTPTTLVVCMVVYGFLAAVLPVWLLLTPRDYLSTFMKVGTIIVLAVGIVVVRPIAQMPDFTEFAFNTEGPVFAGALFPFLFITIACGALSGMHAMVASGTTPKMIQKESQTRMIGYGGMLMESFVAIMALAAAVSLNQGIYFSMNMSAASIQSTAGSSYSAQATPEENAAAAIANLGVSDPAGNQPEIIWETVVDGDEVTLTGAPALEAVADDVGEPSVVSRTGGAPTLAVGMANIMHNVVGGKAMMSFWYHFAIMFEALFILSAVDAVTRVARFQLGDAIGNVLPKFRDPGWRVGSWLTTGVVVAAWGSLLLMGVTDPNGGIRTLFPLFGIANQLIAACALTIVTVMVVKKGYLKWVWIPLVPLAVDTATTFTASFQKIFSSDLALGYWALHNATKDTIAAGGLEGQALADAHATVRNTAIQGTLSIAFLVLVALLMVTALMAVLKAVRAGAGRGAPAESSEDPYEPSHFYAPQGLLVPSPLERKVETEYAQVGDPRLLAGGHH
ncbi:carbon starvation protein CstA, partial [Cellulomonas sp. A375-1]|uniref:carbon starvation CstA family protein n=1 Tax=Cellulomonas sp. A375-1 TaxID=1672219 RepID=UPI00065282C2